MSADSREYTRREAVALAAGAAFAGAIGLAGCGQDDPYAFDSGTHARAGFASDALVKDYPVTLKLYVDSNVQWLDSGEGDNKDRDWGDGGYLDHYIYRYQQCRDRDSVQFDIVYTEPAELLAMAGGGFPDGDGVIALEDTVLAGCSAGALEGGANNYMVRTYSYNLQDHCYVVRAKGSDVELPPAVTLDGEDSSDGKFTKLQQLPEFDGLIAIAEPAVATEGKWAIMFLERLGFYDGELDGYGDFDPSIADKLRFYANQDAAMQAIADGHCQIGFALEHALAKRYPQIEALYTTPPGCAVTYSSAAVAGASEPEVARDFFAFILRCKTR